MLRWCCVLIHIIKTEHGVGSSDDRKLLGDKKKKKVTHSYWSKRN